MKNSILIAAMTIIAGSLHAQTADDSIVLRKMANEILSHGGAYENLRALTKQVGPRLSGSAGAEKAVMVTAKMLKDAGADTVILQECMVPHWVRGEKESAKLILADGKGRAREEVTRRSGTLG